MSTTKIRRRSARPARPTNEPTLTHTHSAVVAQWPVDPIDGSDAWSVYPDASLERWEVYVDVERHRTFVNQDTWDTVAWDAHAERAFLDSFTNVSGVSGMRFIVADAGPYREAVRKEAWHAGTNVPARKDRLEQLNEKAQGLILQAASLNASATEGQAQTFGVRYAQMAADLAVLEQELAIARGLVELAGTAVVDACS